MEHCHSCGGNCGGCSGCAGSLTLTEGELSLLQTLAQLAFLPVARRADTMTPIYLEDSQYTIEEYSMILQHLEAKSLISIDYSAPLGGACMDAYKDYPVHGSIALTQRGQDVIALIETQGLLP